MLALRGAALLALAALALAKGTKSPYWGEYNTTAGPVPGKINVHLVPHTHDDVGWLITVDQYYVQEVTYILDTVLNQLELNPDRKFIYVETGFFERWWIQQTDDTKARFKKIVANGQLEFINGAWAMHDEAGPNYVEMVENTCRGHQFLLKEFGVAPMGTWQIDPFGHTNTQAWLIGQYSGLQFLFFGRMDNADFAMRKNLSSMVAPDVPRSLEWVWQGSKTFGNQYQTFTGELYGGGGGGYGSPGGLDFDGSDNQVQDDPRFHDYNLDSMVDTFVKAAQDQAQHMRTEHVMWAMGSDFNYQNADHWYKNLDKLIHHINLNGTVNAFYSTPSIYTKAKNDAGLTWEARFDDVMPLADNAHHYWSGYFTSRQSLKKYLRVLSNYLQAARQLALLTETTPCISSGNTEALCTDLLEASISITTHHDGLSGTEKQAVADDYAMRMSDGEAQARGLVTEVLKKQVGLDDVFECHGHLGLNISFCSATTTADAFTVVAYNTRGHSSTQMLRIPVGAGNYAVTDSAGKSVAAQLMPITDRDRQLSELYLTFEDAKNPQKRAAYMNNATSVLTFAAAMPAVGWTTFRVTKQAALPKTSMVRQVVRAPAASHSRQVAAAADVTLSNGVYEVTISAATGTLSQIKNLQSGKVASVAIDIGFYNSSIGGCTPGLNGSDANQASWRSVRDTPVSRNRREEFEFGMEDLRQLSDPNFACDGQKSGAYIFRPNSSTVFPASCASDEATAVHDCSAKPTFTVTQGALVNEATIMFNDWATAVVRLAKGMPYVEVEYTVGPIPQYSFEDPAKPYLQGKEVVLRYNTSLQTNGEFYVDSNGREMVKRAYNKRGPAYPNPYPVSEPVAGNYYPCNAIAGLQDDTANVGFHVAVDRSQGAASVANGEIELMVHRRTQADDSRGVAQPMNETMCGCRDVDPNHIGQCNCSGLTIRGTHYLVLDDIAGANEGRRVAAEVASFGALTAFSHSTPKTPSFSAVSAELPANVKLMTFGVVAPQYQNQVYVRLAHLYEAGEHPTLAQTVNVSLSKIFAVKGLTVQTADEISLTGNLTPQQLAQRKMTWKVAGEELQMPAVPGCAAGKPCVEEPRAVDDDMVVTLRPMDIRTFIVTLG